MIVSQVREALVWVRSRMGARDDVRWLDIERFEDNWRERIERMARNIPPGSAVIDFGCGPMWLKKYLVGGTYTGVDYVNRGPGTLVCNFNAKQFPNKIADVAFVSGCLEYVNDPAWFVGQVARHVEACVMSYCTVEDFGDLAARRGNAWVNNLSRSNLIELFAANGFCLAHEDKTPTQNSIFVFCKPGTAI